ncbi:unnamed protein product [Linum tenue]|uniref:Uncharacterized protein n=1 Tax=Linum tenue TaxID=586396 RepID=A0AAV0M4Q5_9ROSI|nr:unnamed protein product [Linum tenue]
MEENSEISEDSSFAAVNVLCDCDCDCDSASSCDDGEGKRRVEVGERLPPPAGLPSLRDSSAELYSELEVGAVVVAVAGGGGGVRKLVSASGPRSWTAALSYTIAASSAVSYVPNQSLTRLSGSLISAAHFPHGRRRTPLNFLAGSAGLTDKSTPPVEDFDLPAFDLEVLLLAPQTGS